MPSPKAKRALLLVATTGILASCVSATSNTALCSRLSDPLDRLSGALADNPQTPQAVGEAGVDVVVVGQSACLG